MSSEYVKQADRVSFAGLLVNFILSAVKCAAGVLAGSAAMVSDSVHSLSDCFSTVVVIIGVHVAGKAADEDHPYGHERLECIAALVLSAMLFATAAGIGYTAVQSIISIVRDGAEEGSELLFLALAAAVLSIVVKFLMYLVTERQSKKLKSTALHGDALHHLSDSLSSVGSLIGVIGAMLGVAILDPIASLVICAMILKAAFDICSLAVGQLVDRAADEDTRRRIAAVIDGVAGVKRTDVLRTRCYGNRIFVEAEIAVDSELSLVAAHKIAESVHEKVENEVEEVKHCTVHVNPMTKDGKEPGNHEPPAHEW